MTLDHDDGRRGRRRLALLIPLLAAATIVTGTASLALFTDTEQADATFSAATISLDPADVASLSLTAGALVPGDVLTDDVTITNDGTAQLRYSVTATSTSGDGLGLRDVLTLSIREVDVTTPASPCSDFDGAVVMAPAVLGSSVVATGDPTPGADAGDRVLAAAAGETLCFRVSLPLATGNAYQGSETTTTFTFDAEQTAHNP